MDDRPTILVVGGTGQIGHELVRELGALGTVVAPTRAELELLSAASIREVLGRVRPAIVVNAAGYTAVDAAESEPELCAAINADAPERLAVECKKLGALFVHYSTDYVFDGEKRTPYVETDVTAPLNVYGKTKLAGEACIAASGAAYLIFRTSWVYGLRGRNFVLSILRLSREREVLSVVNDQVGAPTSAPAIAAASTAVLRVLAGERTPDRRDNSFAGSGVYHMTAGGSTTWFEFARTILADDPRRAEQVCRTVAPITSAGYPTLARRPAYSVLDNTKLNERFGVRLSTWQEQWTTSVRESSAGLTRT
jgi:dTDP-4-dehydrorhamnose reductase